MSTILVTGGTGTIGRRVIPILQNSGHDLRVLSRHTTGRDDGIEYVAVDLLAGTGLKEALDQVDIVLHLAGGPKGDDIATKNLVTAAEQAAVQHLVHISVTAVDQLPLTYFKAKRGAERAVLDSTVPSTVLRVAQLHEFVWNVTRTLAKLPVVPIPGGVRFQPVDSRDVAARLAELTLGEPQGLVPDLVGPKVYTLKELTGDYLRATGKRRPMLPIRVPGKAGKVYRAGGNLTTIGADVGTHGWDEFVAAQV